MSLNCFLFMQLEFLGLELEMTAMNFALKGGSHRSSESGQEDKNEYSVFFPQVKPGG